MPQSAGERDAHTSAPSSFGGWPAKNTAPALILIRHGETEWSRSGQHTGLTDIPLTDEGERQARVSGELVRAVLGPTTPALVVSSNLQRAWRTAELAGFPPDERTEEAAEWDYGQLEGLTTPQIQQDYPDWSIWSGPIPGGEDAAAVTSRLDGLLNRIGASRPSGPVLIFTHGHASRCLAARWLGEPVTAGRHYWLSTGAVSSLGYEHERPVLLRWNVDSSLLNAAKAPA
jgi:probable phosphoglycerate mutase